MENLYVPFSGDDGIVPYLSELSVRNYCTCHFWQTMMARFWCDFLVTKDEEWTENDRKDRQGIRVKETNEYLTLCNFRSNDYRREGCQARSKASGSGPDLAGVRGFESPPSHFVLGYGYLTNCKPSLLISQNSGRGV